LAVSGMSICQEDLAFILEMERIVSLKGPELSLKEIQTISKEYYNQQDGESSKEED
jgi:hypothetical protein